MTTLPRLALVVWICAFIGCGYSYEEGHLGKIVAVDDDRALELRHDRDTGRHVVGLLDASGNLEWVSEGQTSRFPQYTNVVVEQDHLVVRTCDDRPLGVGLTWAIALSDGRNLTLPHPDLMCAIDPLSSRPHSDPQGDFEGTLMAAISAQLAMLATDPARLAWTRSWDGPVVRADWSAGAVIAAGWPPGDSTPWHLELLEPATGRTVHAQNSQTAACVNGQQAVFVALDGHWAAIRWSAEGDLRPTMVQGPLTETVQVTGLCGLFGGDLVLLTHDRRGTSPRVVALDPASLEEQWVLDLPGAALVFDYTSDFHEWCGWADVSGGLPAFVPVLMDPSGGGAVSAQLVMVSLASRSVAWSSLDADWPGPRQLWRADDGFLLVLPEATAWFDGATGQLLRAVSTPLLGGPTREQVSPHRVWFSFDRETTCPLITRGLQPDPRNDCGESVVDVTEQLHADLRLP